jgi:FMN reductase (NADPH)
VAETFNILSSHRSIRKFKPDPIREDIITKIINSARQAPTTSNLQAYSIIIVKNPKKKKALAHLAGDQPWVEACPVFLVICPDLHRLKQVCQMHNYEINDKYIEDFIVAVVDASLVAQNILVAAEAVGLGVCIIGGIRRSPDEVSDLLKLPERVFPLMGICLGYPDQNGVVKPRLPEEVVVFSEEYGIPDIERFIDLYDGQIKLLGLYDGPRRKIQSPDGRNTPDEDYGWSENSARRIAAIDPKLHRSHMRAFLEKQGFKLE